MEAQQPCKYPITNEALYNLLRTRLNDKVAAKMCCEVLELLSVKENQNTVAELYCAVEAIEESAREVLASVDNRHV